MIDAARWDERYLPCRLRLSAGRLNKRLSLQKRIGSEVFAFAFSWAGDADLGSEAGRARKVLDHDPPRQFLRAWIKPRYNRNRSAHVRP